MNKVSWKIKRALFEIFREIFPFQIILKKENENLIYLLEQINISGKYVLDLGVGIGNVIQFLTPASRVYAIDFTKTMLHATQENYPSAGLILADVKEIPVKSNSIDIITAVGLVEYLKDMIPMVEESCRLLKNDGFFLMTFSPPNFWSWLRLVFGHVIYTRKLTQITSVARICSFEIQHHKKTLMQYQVLLKKNVI